VEKTTYTKTEYLYVAPGATLLAPLSPTPILLLGNGETLSRNYQIYKSNAESCEARFNELVNWHKKAAKKYPAAVVK
jgi:hypothetical protein